MSETRRQPPELSAVDRALVEALARDGRATYEALAREVGLSRPAVRDRLRRLLDEGAVRVVGVVHPAVFGLTAYAHAGITVAGAARPVAARLTPLEDVPFVSAVAGKFDLIAEVRSADSGSLAAAVRAIGELPGVRQVETAVYTAILKNTSFPSRPHRAIPLDDLDRKLLRELQRDGRTSFAGLGEAVGLSLSAARARVVRLQESGAVHVGAVVHPQIRGAARHLGFELSLGEGAGAAVEAIQQLPEVQYLATAIGRSDAVGTAIADSPGKLLGFLETVRALPAVRRVDCWSHLHVLKESYETPRRHLEG